MNLKYYLRGLGLGMAVTALILGIAFAVRSKENTMTDEQVIARAKELGMTERTVLTEVQSKEEAQEPEEVRQTEGEGISEKELPKEENTEPEAAEEENEETEQVTEPEPETLEEPVTEEAEPEVVEKETEPGPEVIEKETVLELAVIEIVRGDSSDSVSRKLADMGLVENAAEYDKYLCANGYDKKIRIGTYEIQKGTAKEEIARIIAGN